MRTAEQAIAAAKAATWNHEGWCENFVTVICYDQEDQGGHGASAATLYAAAQVKYATWDEIPIGGIIYLAALTHPRYAGDTAYAAGDVGIKTDSRGGIFSDHESGGVVHFSVPGYMTLEDRVRQVGRPFAGGMGDIAGHRIVFTETVSNTHPAVASAPASFTPTASEEDELSAAADDIKDAIRRDNRYRLFYNTDTKQYFAVNYENGRVMYAHGGIDQVKRWYSPYEIVGDAPENAVKVTNAEQATIEALAKGTDSAFTKGN